MKYLFRTRWINLSIAVIPLLLIVLLTGTVYAAPKVGPISPVNAIIGGNNLDRVGSDGIFVLPNGNVVIVSPNWNGGRGAVTCLTPAQYQAGGIVVSATNSLVGSKSSDQVGYGGIVILTNGNYVVRSYQWDDVATTNVGAVTWVNGSTCIPYGAGSPGAVVSPSNSLIGGAASHLVGSGGITALANGNYVVLTTGWNNGVIYNLGAVTWGNGATGTVGVVSAANSLIGSTQDDQIGRDGIIALSNGHYVVASGAWDNNAVVDAGAVTWGNGQGGTVGAVDPANSLVGSSYQDWIGINGVTALSNGHYVVPSRYWDNGAVKNVGAATWSSGSGGTVGTISIANSLIGTKTDDNVSKSGIIALTNGNYVVGSRDWDNSSASDAGAATWGDGTDGTVGSVSTVNSLVGTNDYDSVGISLTALTNGNYVVGSNWGDGNIYNAGAVTWGNGSTGTVGIVSETNSLVGSTDDDIIGVSVQALSNGHYVVVSPEWDNGAADDAGAVTWSNGLGGTTGTISAANSLVGTSSNDYVGDEAVILLTNGHYVVMSPSWNSNKGAVTWGNGLSGTAGTISAANSLVGSTASDRVGNKVTALTNGNYVVTSRYWQNGAATNAGAATWGNGLGGTVGSINATNSLVGTKTDDRVGSGDITPLSNGNYVVSSLWWKNGSAASAGAVTWGNGQDGTIGAVSPANSLVGTTTDDTIGNNGIIALSDGHYVVTSNSWDNGSAVDAGAITWGNGLGGTVGVVSTTNSLVGSVTSDQVGLGKTIALNNGSYFANAYRWSNGVTYSSGAVVWSNGLPPETNNNPILAEIGDQTVDEGDTLTFDAEATDSDLPAQTLTFSITGEPEGATFDTATGEFSWTPDESHGGEVFNLTVTVTDDGEPAGSDSEAFTITVNEVDESDNQAPVLAAIGDRFGYVGKPLSFVASATDPDLPAQTLTFGLEAGAPAGATIDPVSGVFSWPIDAAVTPGDYPVTITVTDDDASPLSDSKTITITIVQDNFINNYGFENPGTTNKTAAGWNAVKTVKTDQRICNTAQKSVAYEGLCAYRFQLTGQAEPARAIQRKTSSTDFVKGDVLELRGVVKANNLKNGARLVIKAVYGNGKQTVADVVLLPGTYDYQPFSARLTLSRVPVKIVVQVKGGKAKGTFFVDDMAVVVPLPPGASELPPEPPDASEMRGTN